MHPPGFIYLRFLLFFLVIIFLRRSVLNCFIAFLAAEGENPTQLVFGI